MTSIYLDGVVYKEDTSWAIYRRIFGRHAAVDVAPRMVYRRMGIIISPTGYNIDSVVRAIKHKVAVSVHVDFVCSPVMDRVVDAIQTRTDQRYEIHVEARDGMALMAARICTLPNMHALRINGRARGWRGIRPSFQPNLACLDIPADILHEEGMFEAITMHRAICHMSIRSAWARDIPHIARLLDGSAIRVLSVRMMDMSDISPILLALPAVITFVYIHVDGYEQNAEYRKMVHRALVSSSNPLSHLDFIKVGSWTEAMSDLDIPSIRAAQINGGYNNYN